MVSVLSRGSKGFWNRHGTGPKNEVSSIFALTRVFKLVFGPESEYVLISGGFGMVRVLFRGFGGGGVWRNRPGTRPKK